MIESEQLELVLAHNEYRESVGLEALTANPLLMELAQAHAQWMSDKRTMSHGSWWSNNTLSTRIKKGGYRYRGIAENVAAGQSTVAQVFKAWLNSRGHRNNIRGNYTEVGVGRVGDYWCVIFGNPR